MTAHLSPISQARAPGAERLGHLPRTRPWDRTGPGHSCPALTRSASSRSPSFPSRPHDPTLAQRPAPHASAQAPQEEPHGACAEGAQRGRLRSLGCESAIRGFGPAGNSVYKHTARQPARGNPKGSGVGGQGSTEAPAGRPIPSPSQAADCVPSSTQPSYRGPGPLRAPRGAHVVPSRRSGLPSPTAPADRSAPWRRPGAPRYTSRLRTTPHDVSSGLHGSWAWVGRVLVTARVSRVRGPGRVGRPPRSHEQPGGGCKAAGGASSPPRASRGRTCPAGGGVNEPARADRTGGAQGPAAAPPTWVSVSALSAQENAQCVFSKYVYVYGW